MGRELVDECPQLRELALAPNEPVSSRRAIPAAFGADEQPEGLQKFGETHSACEIGSRRNRRGQSRHEAESFACGQSGSEFFHWCGVEVTKLSGKEAA
jgi:hypothetical protein